VRSEYWSGGVLEYGYALHLNTPKLYTLSCAFSVSFFAQLVENAGVDEIARLDFARRRIGRTLLF